MTSGLNITKTVRQKKDWKAPYGPLTASVPGLFLWKPAFKKTYKLPSYGLKTPMCPEKGPQNKDHLAIWLGTDIMNLLIQMFGKSEHNGMFS